MRIDSAKLAHFEALADARFRDRIISYLRENHGTAIVRVGGTEKPLAALPPELLRTMAASQLARGRAQGLDESTTLAAFVILAFLVAPTFDVYPAIAAALKHDVVPPDEAMQDIVDSMTDADWDEVRAASDANAWDTILAPGSAG